MVHNTPSTCTVEAEKNVKKWHASIDRNTLSCLNICIELREALEMYDSICKINPSPNSKIARLMGIRSNRVADIVAVLKSEGPNLELDLEGEVPRTWFNADTFCKFYRALVQLNYASLPNRDLGNLVDKRKLKKFENSLFVYFPGDTVGLSRQEKNSRMNNAIKGSMNPKNETYFPYPFERIHERGLMPPTGVFNSNEANSGQQVIFKIVCSSNESHSPKINQAFEQLGIPDKERPEIRDYLVEKKRKLRCRGHSSGN